MCKRIFSVFMIASSCFGSGGFDVSVDKKNVSKVINWRNPNIVHGKS